MAGQTLLHLHQKSVLYLLVQTGRGTERAKVMNLWKCLNVQHLHHDQTALLCSLDLAFWCETISVRIKNPDKPHHNESELAPVGKKSDQVLKIPIIITG